MYIKTNLADVTFKATADLSKFHDLTKERNRDVVRQKAAEVQDKAIELVPKDTGKLASQIHLEFVNSEKSTAAKVYTKNKIAHFIEYGTGGAVIVPKKKKALAPGATGWFMAKAVIPARAAHPFMKPAIDFRRPSIEAAVKEAISPGKENSPQRGTAKRLSTGPHRAGGSPD